MWRIFEIVLLTKLRFSQTHKHTHTPAQTEHNGSDDSRRVYTMCIEWILTALPAVGCVYRMLNTHIQNDTTDSDYSYTSLHFFYLFFFFFFRSEKKQQLTHSVNNDQS